VSQATSLLKRELGTLESYAALVGILVGAGIFRVTSDAFALTGPSVILGYLLLAPAVLATSVAYSVFLSTSLGREPGGEYTHIARTFGPLTAFVGAWLKLVSYFGAGAFLATVLADYLLALFSVEPTELLRKTIAVACIAFFWFVHARGVRWFGRIQVAMCALLGVSIVVLVVPGVFAIELANYRPFYRGGFAGLAAALPLLFFAFAGFESLAQTAGEVKDSTRLLPVVFLKGILLTTGIFLAMSIVTFGVLPGAQLESSATPMSDVAAVYLPFGAAAFVTLGGVMAVATSLNATMLVPARLGVMLARDGLVPAVLGVVHARRGTPTFGLLLTFVLTALLVVSGQVMLALMIAVLALVLLYALHSLALLLLPRLDPELYSEITVRIPRRVQVAAAVLSVLSMSAIAYVLIAQDVDVLRTTSLRDRLANGDLTAIELLFLWGAAGILFYNLRPRAVAE